MGPVLQVGLSGEQVSVDIRWQGDVLPAKRQSEGVPGRLIGFRGIWSWRLSGVPERHELHMGSLRGCRQALRV